MNTISASRVAPHIAIEHYRQEDYANAESALQKLNSRPNGKSLLDELRKLSTDGRYVKIKVTSADTAVSPFLTESQVKRFDMHPSEYDKEHNMKAVQLAQKQSLGKKGEGTCASVDWNPRHSIAVDSHGVPMLWEDNALAFVSLGHELVHSYRMMKGTYTGGSSDRLDPKTAAGQEESRAVGIGKYANEPLSENGIRQEHGLPLRQQYAPFGKETGNPRRV
nr:XopG/HopH/AvrPtoH family type III secretion system effector [Pantoea sp. 201603H]